MKNILRILFLLLFDFSFAWADPPPFTSILCSQPGHKGFIFEIQVGSEKIKIPFAIFLPKDYDSEKKRLWPMLIFLHGAGEGGTNLQGVFFSIGPNADTSRTPAMMENLPFILCAPQTNLLGWNTHGWDEKLIKGVVSLTQILPESFRIDRDKISITGLSMGGTGSWAALAEAPDLFASAVPFCSRPWVKTDAISLSLQNCPTWNVVGGADGVEFMNMTKSMHFSQQSVGAESILTIIPNVGHQVWEVYYKNPVFYHWLLRQTRPTNEMKAQAEVFRNLQTEENSLFSVGANVTLPERQDNLGLIPGWSAQWFNDLELKTPLLRRTESKIEYAKDSLKLPYNINNNFSVRFNGWIKIEKSGFYSFTTIANFGTRLFLGNQKLIDNWNRYETGLIEKCGKIRLKQGWHKLIVENYQGKGNPSLSVFWSGPDKDRCVITEKDIYSDPILK